MSTTRTRSLITFFLLAFSQFIISIDYNIVYVALPDIGRDLSFDAQSLQWVVSAYAVGYGGFMLLGGRAVDRLGARRMFLLGLLLFGVSSLAGALAQGAQQLVAARAVQGLGAALLFPASLSLIGIRFADGPERHRAMALWGVAGASGALAGPLAGGLLTGLFGWQSVLLVNVPLVGVAVVAALRLLPPDPQPQASGSFDIPGALVVTVGSSLVVFGLVSGPAAGWWSTRGAGCLVLGAALLVAFGIVERRSRDPLIPSRLGRNRSLITATATIFVLQGTINALHYMFFINLSDVLGYSALQSGLAFLPLSLFAIIGSGKFLPVLLRRLGIRRTLWLGILGTGISMVALAAVMSTSTSYWPLLPVGLFWGVCAGLTYPAIFAAVGSGVAPGEQGVSSALASTAGQIGGAVGLAALVAVANAVTGEPGGQAAAAPDLLAGLRAAVLVAGIVTIAVAFLPLAMRKPQIMTYEPEMPREASRPQSG